MKEQWREVNEANKTCRRLQAMLEKMLSSKRNVMVNEDQEEEN